MPYPAPKPLSDRSGLYRKITDRIIAERKQGRLLAFRASERPEAA